MLTDSLTSKQTSALQPIFSRVRTDATALKDASGQISWTRTPLTAALMANHLNGGPACGVSPIKAGESTTMLGLLDLDSHKGESTWDEMLEAAQIVADALRAHGMEPIAFRSSGGKGVHLFVLWDKPQDAYSVQRALIGALASVGFKSGAGGVSRGEIEVFPKQSSVAADKFGNMFVIPMSGRSEPLDLLFGETTGVAGLLMMEWPTSQPVRLCEKPPVTVLAAGSTSIATLRNALAQIRNDGMPGSPDYDEWRDIIFGIHEGTGGSNEGLELAIEFSARNPNHDEKFLRERVWPYVENRAGGVTHLSILHKARQANPKWHQPHELDFTDDAGNSPSLDEAEAASYGQATEAAISEHMARTHAAAAIDKAKRTSDDLKDCTDAGNVNVMAEMLDGNLRYVYEQKLWIFWSGVCWVIDETGAHAIRAAMAIHDYWRRKAREKKNEADCADGDLRKALNKAADALHSWASRCRNKAGIDAVLALASRDARFAISAALLDRDRLLIGVQNGVVDLRTCKLRAGARNEFITKRCTVPYVEAANAERWQLFIEEIAGAPIAAEFDEGAECVKPGTVGRYMRRPELAAYLHRAAGYSLTGAVNEHKMFIATGGGSNGKSVFFEVIADILGRYAVQQPADALMASSRDSDSERATPNAMRQVGARLVLASEAKHGQQIDGRLVKNQTGDRKATARGLHKDPIEYEITHKLWLLTNPKPQLDHLDDAIRGRIHVVPFDRVWNRPGMPDRDPMLPDGDKHLMEKLQAEREGILAWLVRGAAAYLRDGLTPPPEVVAKTSDYLQEQDAFGQWLAQCERCDVESGTLAGDLSARFDDWCSGSALSDRRIGNAVMFGLALKSAGIESRRTNAGRMYGLRRAVTG